MPRLCTTQLMINFCSLKFWYVLGRGYPTLPVKTLIDPQGIQRQAFFAQVSGVSWSCLGDSVDFDSDYLPGQGWLAVL